MFASDDCTFHNVPNMHCKFVSCDVDTFDDRGFAADGPGLWNWLQSQAKEAYLSYNRFRRLLKTIFAWIVGPRRDVNYFNCAALKVGTCESFFFRSNRIESTVRFVFESNLRIESALYQASRNTACRPSVCCICYDDVRTTELRTG